MSNLLEKFNNLLGLIQESLSDCLDCDGNFPKPGRKPKFTDSEVIALSLLAELLMMTSENYFFYLLNKRYKADFPNLIDRSAYNRRRRNLSWATDSARQYFAKHLTESETTFIIDSMPIAICKFSRAKRIKICKEQWETAPSFGRCPAQKMTFLGYKLHSVASQAGVITSYDLSKAETADIHYLQDIKHLYPGCLLLADRAYLSHKMQLDLFDDNRLILKTPMRRNQKNYMKQPAVFRKVRKRIETNFSQLVDQFSIQKNYAKSFSGFSTRIIAKITAFTVSQYINFINNKRLGHIKTAFI